MAAAQLWRPSRCCEGLAAVIGSSYPDPWDRVWDWMECVNCKRTYFDYDTKDDEGGPDVSCDKVSVLKGEK